MSSFPDHSKYQTSERALLAMRQRLYVCGWRLRDSLIDAAMNPELYSVELAFDQGFPVGVMIAKHGYYAKCIDGKPPEARHRRVRGVKVIGLQVFVRASHRGRGIASELVQRIAAIYPERKFAAGVGIPGSDKLWRRHGVRPWLWSPKQTPEDWVYT